MKLARHLIAAVILVMVLVMSANAYLSVDREYELLRSRIRREQQIMARALSEAVSSTWRGEGRTAALSLVVAANMRQGDALIRWVWLDAPIEEVHRPHVRADILKTMLMSQETAAIEDAAGDDRIFTYTMVSVPEPRRGALELSEAFGPVREYARASVVRIFISTAVVAVVCAVTSLVLGFLFVGRPVRSLIEQARRVGSGDLSQRITFTQDDEMAELARETNAMCDRLAEAKERLAVETYEKIAMLEAMRHADRLKTVGQLASGVAHELGTPLNVVLGRAKMVIDQEGIAAEPVKHARSIVEQAERMTVIIRQLLDFARRRGPKLETMGLRQMSEHAVTMLSPLAEKRGVTLAIVPGPEAGVLELDSNQIHQALANLIVNAVQAMPKAGTVRISIERRRARPPPDRNEPEGDYVALEVADEGVGIPTENLSRLFDPFFTTKAVGEGTGLGLSVSYGIVRDHGGWIGVGTEPGKGSRFTIYLPAQKRAAAEGGSG